MTNVFLTGATGFLGHYTLAALLARKDVIIRALLSPPLEESRQRLTNLLAEIDVDLHSHLDSDRVELVEGRLPDNFPNECLRNSDVVIHTAASTRFCADQLDEPYRSNVDGTHALLSAAKRMGVPHIVYISTAYVGGQSSTSLPEAMLLGCAAEANDYECAKYLAEQAVLAWAESRNHATIVRPSILIGDTAAGRATSFGGIYVLARAVELLARAAEHDASIDRHAIPLRIMGSTNYPVNLTPVDFVAGHIADIALGPPTARHFVNLVNPSPPTIGDVKSWLEDVFNIGGGRFTNDIWPWPAPSPCEESFYAAGDSVHAYFRRNVRFESKYLADRGVTGPLVTAEHFKKCIGYARDRHWGRRPPRAQPHGEIDPATYFETFMPEHLPRSTVARIDTFTAVVRYIIAGTHNAEWTCRYDAGRLVDMHRGPNTLHEDFGFRVTADAFDRIVTGRQSLQQTYFDSNAEIFGNTFMALKMVPIIDAFLSEHPFQPNAADIHAG